MTVVQINSTCGVGSTGKICVGISELLTVRGVANYIAYSGKSNGYHLGIPYSNEKYIHLQALKSRVFGNYGFNAVSATRKLITELKQIQPDIIHLHNIHSHDCDLEMLFCYIKAEKIKLVWTFHDCWAFTGYCPHYDMIGCDKWKTSCGNCPQRKTYSWFFDRSKAMQHKKKELFSGLNLTIVTPSRWLAEQVGDSFLKEYPVKVINNGIDLDVFQPQKSDFRRKHGCENKFVLLGVSFEWSKRKGLDVFIELARRLDERFQIILVGTDSKVDVILPENILSIYRTQNQKELAEIYSAADLLLNPTREENYPTVNLEAIACGTPVLTFQTGGSSEMLDKTCGGVVPKNDIGAMERAIINIYENRPYNEHACVQRASAFNKEDRFEEYVRLYGG